MVILSQRDRRWSAIKMLPSSLTLGRYGCTTTSISMLSDYFNCFRSPDQIVDFNIKYTIDGLIKWESINFTKFRFEKRVRSFDPVAIEESLKNPIKAVILEVWNHTHWVVAIKKDIFGNYVIADPWDGNKKTIKKSEITGSAHFISF